MTTSKIGFGLASAIAVAGVVFATTQHQSEAKLRDENEVLRLQALQATGDAQRFSNQLAQVAGDQAGTDAQLRELMRLRGEVGVLKRQLAEASKVQKNESSAKAQALAESSGEKPQTMNRGRDAKIVGYAFRMYANNHQDQFPSDFVQVIPYMDEALRADMNPGDVLRDRDQFIAQVTNRFEIVFTGSTTNEADTSKILFREKQATQASDGTWIKAYCFVDGSGQLHSEPDGNFESWEKQHMPGYSDTQQGR
jgi:hypothetical protein